MTDVISVAERSALMSKVRNRNTRPEMVVRRALHGAGYRYRLHIRNLPGTPDIVFPKKKAVVFVHGCFWHGHDNCRLASVPKTRTDFWLTKINGNRSRDCRVQAQLHALGWRVHTVWQCQTADVKAMVASIKDFLD